MRAVLTGTIAQLGDDLLVSVELSDVRDRRHIWGERYRKPLADILVRHTSDTEAHRLYLQGRYYLNQRSAEAISKAQEINQATSGVQIFRVPVGRKARTGTRSTGSSDQRHARRVFLGHGSTG